MGRGLSCVDLINQPNPKLKAQPQYTPRLYYLAVPLSVLIVAGMGG